MQIGTESRKTAHSGWTASQAFPKYVHYRQFKPLDRADDLVSDPGGPDVHLQVYAATVWHVLVAFALRSDTCRWTGRPVSLTPFCIECNLLTVFRIIIHSVNDPVQWGVDFDEERVLMVSDWL